MPRSAGGTLERSERRHGQVVSVDTSSWCGLRNDIAKGGFEPITGQFAYGRHEVQVMGGRYDRNVAHEHGEPGQVGLNVGAIAVPADQRLHGEAVAPMPSSA